MKKLLILFLLLPVMAFAADEKEAPPARDVPAITFAQKVPIVVEAKRNPMLLDFKIDQDKQKIILTAIADKNVDRNVAKKIAFDLVMLTKMMSLDDHPKDAKKPGRGLYDYAVSVTRADGIVLAVGSKPAGKTRIMFDPPAMEYLPAKTAPLIHADEADQ